jgi:hypothetical protein
MCAKLVTRPTPYQRELMTIAEWQKTVAAAAAPFEGRWRLASLRAVDAELYQRMVEQLGLWQRALVTGDGDAVAEQGAATCRGWNAVFSAMEGQGVEDDAYLVGSHEGHLVAIGEALASISRVRERFGAGIVFMSPSEVACLVSGVTALTRVKEVWPAAELTAMKEAGRFADEPAQGDLDPQPPEEATTDAFGLKNTN